MTEESIIKNPAAVPALITCIRNNGAEAEVEQLIQGRADVNECDPLSGDSPLMVAALRSPSLIENLGLVQYLEKVGANIDSIDNEGKTVLDRLRERKEQVQKEIDSCSNDLSGFERESQLNKTAQYYGQMLASLEMRKKRKKREKTKDIPKEAMQNQENEKKQESSCNSPRHPNPLISDPLSQGGGFDG